MDQNWLTANWRYAEEEWASMDNQEGSQDPKDNFCLGYVLGIAWGLALSGRAPKMADFCAGVHKDRLARLPQDMTPP